MFDLLIVGAIDRPIDGIDESCIPVRCESTGQPGFSAVKISRSRNLRVSAARLLFHSPHEPSSGNCRSRARGVSAKFHGAGVNICARQRLGRGRCPARCGDVRDMFTDPSIRRAGWPCAPTNKRYFSPWNAHRESHIRPVGARLPLVAASLGTVAVVRLNLGEPSAAGLSLVPPRLT